MARTRVPSEQLQFRSQNTGNHLLDTYLEDAEMGSLTLATLMAKLFDEATGDIDAFEFRYANTPADGDTEHVRPCQWTQYLSTAVARI